ncbi:T9SS type A sorting domain-containing protein [Algoriphagus kandeliae]|uniref:T9SS type A sorting domain-containing protein n=1 Tax=Algoriphagus kandeliae TaxID=2562278 RepID=A0A4Y9QQR7_9BACT|nr:S8 family serine peptidase [Algoriphagus kandeliae]TFV94580.1 T9SS type A sorting domain-containing protein [Algoriphagus kandeliae]
MRRKFTLIGILLLALLGVQLNAQESQEKQDLLKKAREEVQSNLQKTLEKLRYIPNTDILQKFDYLNANGDLDLGDGFVSKIQFLDESGSPVFYAPHNKNAAITTGAVTLQPEGELGLNLTGKGLTVGIFDQTRPKPDHVEFQGRLTQIDGSSEDLSTHATHVSGTVLGGGVNPSARGMAYEATGWSFNWEADISKMNANAYDPESKTNGILISNHSYGIVLGWRNNGGSWTWFGNATVDPDKDWRFGFYSTKSQAIDELLYSKPYYSVVWSAGNDRDDVGDGTRDPDGPDDTIGPEGVAKNNFAIGAVEQVLDYKGPEDVKMSGFSSWGPVDDGRIKPDLVAMGVNVFSASIGPQGADSYASQSGTSMAAPNATGSMFLLQQLYSERNSGRFMLSSALKALAIHTAKEAGPSPGPDYMYGWGLLDVNAAAKIILNEDGSSQFIREDILGEGEFHEFKFVSDGVTPIRATIAWTDPAGTPPGQANNPTNLMLVNDLDLRIFDEDGKEYFPWTLDPTQRAGARAQRTSDNFRDNVEQVLIDNPEPKLYTVRINHKNNLQFGVQQYAFVFTGGTVDGADETLYWIGGANGDWNDGNNWSSTSGGSPAGKIPSAGSRVVFEGREGGAATVSFPSAANAFSINLFGDQTVSFDLKGNEVRVSNGFRVSNQITEIKNGTLVFENSDENSHLVEFGQTTFDNVNLNFNSGNWRLIDAEVLGNVRIDGAHVKAEMLALQLKSLEMVGSGSLDGGFSYLNFEDDLIVEPNASLKAAITATFKGESGLFNVLSSEPIEELHVTSGNLTLLSEGFEHLNIENSKVFLDRETATIQELSMGPSSELDLGPNGQLVVQNNISSSATASLSAKIRATNKGEIVHNIYRKYCFENLSIENVDLEGQAIVNLGTEAVISNSNGWLAQNCDDVLFANFRVLYPCEGAAVTFENLSEGAISSYSWDFDGRGNSSLENPFFVFDSPGTYMVKLTIANESGSTLFEQTVEIGINELVKPVIVANGNSLTSQQPGDAYQWYLNGEAIPGATTRSIQADADGSYQVAIFNASCNRVSDPVVISAIPNQEQELSRFGIFVGPIPSEDQIKVMISNEYRGLISLSIVDMAGRVYRSADISKNTDEIEVEMNLPATRGIYILKINTNQLTLHKKVIKQ